jgi:hypothetical protein
MESDPQWPAALVCVPRGFIAYDLRRVLQRLRHQPQSPKLRAGLEQWETRWLPASPETVEQAVDELLTLISELDQ